MDVVCSRRTVSRLSFWLLLLFTSSQSSWCPSTATSWSPTMTRNTLNGPSQPGAQVYKCKQKKNIFSEICPLKKKKCVLLNEWNFYFWSHTSQYIIHFKSSHQKSKKGVSWSACLIVAYPEVFLNLRRKSAKELNHITYLFFFFFNMFA